MAPLVLPEIIIAISMLLVMLQLGLSLSLFTVVLGHILICIPYSMTVLVSGFEGFDRSLEEASADLGESAFGTFRRVTLPMVAPAIISSLLVSFTISLDVFIIAFSSPERKRRCRSTSGGSCVSRRSCPACWRWARCFWLPPSC
jgi:spermidine/putrescine transport system permease protein